MPQTYTRFGTPTTSVISGTIFTNQQSVVITFETFFTFPDFTSLYVADNIPFAANIGFTTTNVVVTPVTLLAELSDPTNGVYTSFDGTGLAWTATSLPEGLYHYALETGSGATEDETQYLLVIPTIESAIITLAEQLQESQCNCKLNVSLRDKFVKALGLLELIRERVKIASTEFDQDFYTEINADIEVLSDFLGGTNPVCGC